MEESQGRLRWKEGLSKGAPCCHSYLISTYGNGRGVGERSARS